MSRFVRPLFALLLLFAGALPTAAFAQSADLSVIIADQSAYSVDRGDTLTFSITVINGGPDATVATLTNQLVTSDLTATSLSGPGATCTLGTLQCTMALGDGESSPSSGAREIYDRGNARSTCAGRLFGRRALLKGPGNRA